MQYLVLGASGYIGSYLYKRLKQDREKVIGTRNSHQDSDLYVCFDILKDHFDDINSLIDDKEKIAVFCIGQSNINYCYENYAQAYQINVVKTKEWIHELAQSGFQVLFFSTDCVFDGLEGNYTECSKTHAVNQYGMMKEEMEHYLLDSEPEVCIFRISKVVSTERIKQNVLYEWECQCENGKQIKCMKGNYLSFISMEDIYQACRIASERNMHGLYNIAGDHVFSRADLARLFCKKWGFRSADIAEYDVAEFGFKDCRPLNTSMSNLKFKKETGFAFTPISQVIDQYIMESRS